MHIAIIGAGISGLTAGALLAKAGHEVHIYEQNPDIGGVTGGFKKNGFYWDMGQLNLEGLGPGEQAGKILDELGLRSRLKLIPADRAYAFPDFTIKPPAEYGGPWWRREFFINQFPGEKRGILRYYRYYRRMMAVVTLARRAEAAGRGRAAFLKARMYANLLPLLPKAQWSAQRLMDHYFQSPELKAAFTSILADFVVRPEEFQGLGVALVNPEPAFDKRVPLKVSSAGRQPSYCCIEGGCRALVELLAETIRSHRGEIHTGCEVAAIRTLGGKVQGLRLADGASPDADLVLASGGAQDIFNRLLEPGVLEEGYQRIVDNVPQMESVFMVHLGIDIDPSQYLESPVTYYYGTYEIGPCIAKLQSGVYHEGLDGFVLCCPSLLSPGAAPEGRHALTVYTVSPDTVSGCEWSDKKREWADKLLDLVQQKIPGLKDHITEMEIFTPEDFRRLTHQRHHSFGGCAPVMGRKAAPHRTPVQGLWFIGSQSESGAGVNGAMEGAWRVYRKILYNKQE